MRKTLIGLTLLALAGCGSEAPQPRATDKGLGGAVEAAARPSPNPVTGSDAPLPEALGGAAVE